jgi:hypothetical protein
LILLLLQYLLFLEYPWLLWHRWLLLNQPNQLFRERPLHLLTLSIL